jgi:hypothetical protein
MQPSIPERPNAGHRRVCIDVQIAAVQHHGWALHINYFQLGLACVSVVCNYITKSPKHLDDSHVTGERS